MATHIDRYRLTVGRLRRPDLRKDFPNLDEALQALADSVMPEHDYSQIDAVNDDGSYKEIVVLDRSGVYA